MPIELTGASIWRPTITAPADGDPRNAASVNVGLQDLADSLQYLHNTALPYRTVFEDVVSGGASIADANVSARLVLVTIPNCQAGDKLFLDCAMQLVESAGITVTFSVGIDGSEPWKQLSIQDATDVFSRPFPLMLKGELATTGSVTVSVVAVASASSPGAQAAATVHFRLVRV